MQQLPHVTIFQDLARTRWAISVFVKQGRLLVNSNFTVDSISRLSTKKGIFSEVLFEIIKR